MEMEMENEKEKEGEEAKTTRQNPTKPTTVGEYVIKSKIGEGCFSTVWKGQHIVNGEEVVAVKQVYLSRLNRHLRTCLDCELTFLSSVNHPNIVRLFHVFRDKDCIFLILEFCSGGNLAFYIHRHGRVQEHIARRFMQQLGAGLEILHSHHIIHRDLKPEGIKNGKLKIYRGFLPEANILLSGTEEDPVLKIADFGLSRSVNPGEYAETVCGSPLYMAPEVLGFQRYDEKVDMWSVGAILFELLNGYPPFRGRNNAQVLKNINSSTRLPFSQVILPRLNPDCVDVCLKLLSPNPANRLSFDEFYWHKFLRRKRMGI